MKAFILSFGDSGKFIVPFDGSLEEFEKSEKLKQIKDKLYEAVKDKLPTEKYKDVLDIQIEECTSAESDYRMLDENNFEKLKKEMERQGEVKAGYQNLNKNARYDDHN